MRYLVIAFLAAWCVSADKTSEGKKRTLVDVAYPNGMVIRTNFNDEQGSGYLKNDGLTGGYQLALLSTVPYSTVPVARPLPILRQQYYVVRGNVAIPVNVPYQQTSSIYGRLPYQVPKYPFHYGNAYPYEYNDPYQYYIQRPSPYITVPEGGIDYLRPPIDERSTYRVSTTLQKPGTAPFYIQRPSYYVSSEKDSYATSKPLGYAIGVPTEQVPVQKEVIVQVEKNEE